MTSEMTKTTSIRQSRKTKGKIAGDQSFLFDCREAWRDSWKGMPAFHQDKLDSPYRLIVHFREYADLRGFAKLIGQPAITDKTVYIYHPEQQTTWVNHQRWISSEKLTPQYPIYIPSKGRAKTPKTANELDRIGVPYKIVVEPQEYDDYASALNPDNILVLPFSNLGKGSTPARNWIWEHSIAQGDERHWQMDDNIQTFQRLVDNTKVCCGCGAFLKASEDFTDRYENVLLSGLNYVMFTPRKEYFPPYRKNRRIYSCILIKNESPYRWRGKHNEDTDLSLRVLKGGYCTILFNAFVAMKIQTMRMKGGNEELYVGDGRLKATQALQEQHPDVTTITRKWGRWHHHVDYSPFKDNKLILKPGIVIEDKPNEYGMKLETVGIDKNVQVEARRAATSS